MSTGRIWRRAATSQAEQRDGTDTLLAKLVEEIGAQRRLQELQQAAFLMQEKQDRRWRTGGRLALIALPFLFGMYMYASSMGYRPGPFGDVVGIVHVDGEIAADAPASANRIIPALQDAFENRNVTRIVLAIDSPGGAPVEAERISRAIQSLRARHRKPIVAVISNVGASAAYMIALHADSIVAARYSLVGSIGAIIAPWQFDRAMERVGVSQRVYASGKLKSFLNPFAPVSKDAEDKAQELVDYAGRTFLADLNKARGGLLKPGVDFSTGEVWSGGDAKKLGLVDTVGTIDELTTGKGLRSYNFGPYSPPGMLFGRAFAQAVVSRDISRPLSITPQLR